MTIGSSGIHLRPPVAALGVFRHALTAVVAGAALSLAAPGPARADTGASDWRFGLMVYGWLPHVSGTLRYDLPLGAGGSSFDVSAGDLLGALEMTFMASFEARKGDWSAFTDLIYLDLQGGKARSVSLPGGAASIPLDADLQLTGWIWTLGGGYSLWRDGGSHLDLIAGGRLLAMDTDLTLTGADRWVCSARHRSPPTCWMASSGSAGGWPCRTGGSFRTTPMSARATPI